MNTILLPSRPSRLLAQLLLVGCALLCAGAGRGFAADDLKQLWQIGAPDNDNREFALAPNGYNRFTDDGIFVVGRSDAKRDWPYVHPGPHDAWAGAREHPFVILFGVKSTPTSGECRLNIDLLDTHRSAPGELRVAVNGTEFIHKLPPGGGDETVNGQVSKGREHKFEIPFPATLLKAGANEITLTARNGSWLLYDSLGFDAPASVELAEAGTTVLSSITSVPALVEKKGGFLRKDEFFQPVRVAVRHLGNDAKARITVTGAAPLDLTLTNGLVPLEIPVAAVEKDTEVKVDVTVDGKPLASRSITLKPVRKLTVFILPHSHTDIGYTEIQTEIEDKQVNNLLQGIAYARQTATNPPGARFVWNVEVLWAADLYLRRLSEAQRKEFFDALKKGQISLNAMYLNELTGLCRPEELIRLFRFATQLGEQTGAPVDAAMISDVPGYTWGLVPAMAHAGVRYFSTAPNFFDRIGDILVQWENKPFWWVGPDGKSKVLVWIPLKGYAMSHIVGKLTPEWEADYMAQLEKRGYPYDIAHIRWSGHGDNAVPDPAICGFVKDWNTKYAWPKFVISSTSDAFRAFEKKYGEQLPSVAGDWTPYWEDGAGSSALETAVNRASSDRVTQAEALWAMFDPRTYPVASFEDAWRNVLLYSEHTWGAWCSIGEPFRRETREQWAIKQGYAVSADIQSRDLLSRALSLEPGAVEQNAVDVFNTASWPRTEVVVVPKFLSEGRNRVTDESGAPVASQRLRTGELVLLARDVPPFSAKRFHLTPGQAHADGKVTGAGATLDNGLLKIRVDEKTGGIVELRLAGLDANLADTADGQALNEYLYFNGDNPADAKRNGPVKISVREAGPLIASLLIESDAPGCHRLERELRLVVGQDFVEVINTLDKERLVAASYHAKEGKESLNFGFPFAVPDGQVRLEVPFGVIRPDDDQIPSACKNWFTVGRWADVANADFGITWVTLDAPLVQVGGLTANLINSQANPDVWRKKVGPTQKLYSWAMNNHWGTNYRAHQEGPHVFRFLLRPHKGYDPLAASRLAIAASQPLLPAPARGPKPGGKSRLTLSSPDVLVTALKPSDDGKAIIVRLWGASGRDAQTQVAWSTPAPKKVWLSNTSEKPLEKVSGAVAVPAWGVVTLRAELK